MLILFVPFVYEVTHEYIVPLFIVSKHISNGWHWNMSTSISLDLRPSSSICFLMLSHSIAWVWQRTGHQFGGAAKEQQIEGLVDLPMKLPKLLQTCPNFWMRFYLTKRGERQSDIIDSLFLFYLELYILNSAVI